MLQPPSHVQVLWLAPGGLGCLPACPVENDSAVIYSLERLSKEPELLRADQEHLQRQAQVSCCSSARTDPVLHGMHDPGRVAMQPISAFQGGHGRQAHITLCLEAHPVRCKGFG